MITFNTYDFVPFRNLFRFPFSSASTRFIPFSVHNKIILSVDKSESTDMTLEEVDTNFANWTLLLIDFYYRYWIICSFWSICFKHWGFMIFCKYELDATKPEFCFISQIWRLISNFFERDTLITMNLEELLLCWEFVVWFESLVPKEYFTGNMGLPCNDEMIKRMLLVLVVYLRTFA